MERDIERYLVKQVRAIGGQALKFVSPGHAGAPDRLILLPRGAACFVELKAHGQQPTLQQKSFHKMLRKLGFPVYVLDSKWRIDQLANEWEKSLHEYGD